MRCKKHLSDLSSTVGICASCLRERLVALLAAQVQAQQQTQLARVASRASVASDDCSRTSDTNAPQQPPPLLFPRSVSPYVSRRKSDVSRLFYSTPQVGPTFCGGGDGDAINSARNGNVKPLRKRKNRFWIFSKLFRSRSEKFRLDPNFSTQESFETSSSASPWFSTIFPSRRKNQDRTTSSEDPSVTVRRPYRPSDRGMSPVRTENLSEGYQSPSGSGYSSVTEPSPAWRKTPGMAARRSRLGHGKHVSASSMAFCLSPLVRASPNRWLGYPKELVSTADTRCPAANPHLSAAASFCANRSRKLVDLGRIKQNR